MYTSFVNDAIREAMKAAISARGLNNAKLGRELGMPRSSISRYVSGISGDIPDKFQAVLDHLELDLVAVPKVGEGEQVAVVDGDVLAVLNNVLAEHGKEWVLGQLQPQKPNEAQDD